MEETFRVDYPMFLYEEASRFISQNLLLSEYVVYRKDIEVKRGSWDAKNDTIEFAVSKGFEIPYPDAPATQTRFYDEGDLVYNEGQ